MEHSPLPWKHHNESNDEKYDGEGRFVIYDADERRLTVAVKAYNSYEIWENQANAAYLCKTANAYPKLVEVLRLAVDAYTDAYGNKSCYCTDLKGVCVCKPCECRALLAELEEEG